jgi:hypothetical protein
VARSEGGAGGQNSVHEVQATDEDTFRSREVADAIEEGCVRRKGQRASLGRCVTVGRYMQREAASDLGEEARPGINCRSESERAHR